MFRRFKDWMIWKLTRKRWVQSWDVGRDGYTAFSKGYMDNDGVFHVTEMKTFKNKTHLDQPV